MQRRQSHNIIPLEAIHSNNYYIMPKSFRSSQTTAETYQVKKVASNKNFDQYDQIYNSEKILNTLQKNNPFQQNIEIQQALHYTEQNTQYLSRQHQQLLQNNVDLQTLYNNSEIENKNLQNELKRLHNKVQIRENELNQAQENGASYIKEIAELKIQLQKLNSLMTKVADQNSLLKDQLNEAETQSFLQDKGFSSRRDLNYQNEFNLSGTKFSQNSRQQSQSAQNLQINSLKPNDNISNYQNQIFQYQKEITEKNQLISSLQQQVKNLNEFQQQLIQKSQKKTHSKDLKSQLQSTPNQTPIQNLRLNNESQIMSNKNLLNLIDDQQKTDHQFYRTRQSDEFDVGPSVKSSLTNLKSKQQLQQIYKKINQSTIYTAGLYSSLLDYQFLSNSKLLSSSCSKDMLQQ